MKRDVQAKKYLAQLVKQSLSYHKLSAYPGVCYFARLPNGNIKIGFSNTERLARSRMGSLSRQYGGEVVMLKLVKGGFAAEAYYHDWFEESRVDPEREEYWLTPDIREFLDS